MSRTPLTKFAPGRIVLLAMLCAITTGTFILSLPMARTKPIALIDLIFTATSTLCVTGFFTIPLESFTYFGQIVLMILMQVGGIGLITLTIFLFSLFVDLGFAHQLMAGKILELESWKNLRRLILFITIFTITVESLGALALYPLLYQFRPDAPIFVALFHAIASFCNAGISLFPESFAAFEHNHLVLIVTTLLMLIGGLGFITWREILYYVRSFKKKKRYSFSLHSKIVLFGTAGLITLATILFVLFEYNKGFVHMNFFQKWNNALFQAVSFRSSGYTTVPLDMLSLPTLFITLFIMFIGASPGSTGSGVKITTITIFLASIKAAIADRRSVEIRGRRLEQDQVYRAIAIIALSVTWICTATLILLVTESGWGFLELLLEAISAFANVGMSMNVTSNLTFLGKLCILASMVVGRIGSLSLILALRQVALKKKSDPKSFTYPTERVMLS